MKRSLWVLAVAFVGVSMLSALAVGPFDKTEYATRPTNARRVDQQRDGKGTGTGVCQCHDRGLPSRPPPIAGALPEREIDELNFS